MCRDERVTDEMVKRAAQAFSCACATYPDGSAKTPITDWFKMDAQDAFDFGVLKQPKWDGYSDIRAAEQEDYLAAVAMQPMRAALSAALSIEQMQPDGWQHRTKQPGAQWSEWRYGRANFSATWGIIYEDRPLYAHPTTTRIADSAEAGGSATSSSDTSEGSK